MVITRELRPRKPKVKMAKVANVTKRKHPTNLWMEKYKILEKASLEFLKGEECVVPQSHKELGGWAKEQRKIYANGKLPIECSTLLDKLSFRWSKPQEKDDWHFQRLERYRGLHPPVYLNSFVGKMRMKLRKRESIDSRWIDLLQSLKTESCQKSAASGSASPVELVRNCSSDAMSPLRDLHFDESYEGDSIASDTSDTSDEDFGNSHTLEFELDMTTSSQQHPTAGVDDVSVGIIEGCDEFSTRMNCSRSLMSGLDISDSDDDKGSKAGSSAKLSQEESEAPKEKRTPTGGPKRESYEGDPKASDEDFGNSHGLDIEEDMTTSSQQHPPAGVDDVSVGITKDCDEFSPGMDVSRLLMDDPDISEEESEAPKENRTPTGGPKRMKKLRKIIVSCKTKLSTKHLQNMMHVNAGVFTKCWS